MRIRITNAGIYGATGPIPVGTELNVSEPPKGLEGKYEVIEAEKAKVAVTNPANDGGIKAVHNGGGRYVVKKGDDVLLTGLSKDDAGAFNELSDEDKAAYVEAEKAKG